MAIESSLVGVVLLAAGRGARFGGDKLGATAGDRPLAHHAAATLGGIGFADAIAVVGARDLDMARFGFRLVRAPERAPMSASIACGVAALGDCDACLIALADMPFVPERHVRALLGAYEGGVIATICDTVRSVPAIFPREMFPALQALTGDRGAAALLPDACTVVADPVWMRDIDTLDDLSRAHDALMARH